MKTRVDKAADVAIKTASLILAALSAIVGPIAAVAALVAWWL